MIVEKLQKWIISSEINEIEQELKRKKEAQKKEYNSIDLL